MKIRWSSEAAIDSAGIVDYIRTENPSAARRISHSFTTASPHSKGFLGADPQAGWKTLAN